MQELYTSAQAQGESFEISKVLRNTYSLLAMTLAFSAFTAYLAMVFNMPHFGLLTLIPFFVLLWLVEKNKNNASGIFWAFAFTGWLGATLGPILNAYLAVRGAEPIIMALGGTAVIFFAMSGYILVTKKDMSFMTGFLMTGILVAFIAAIANAFFQIQGLALAVSALFLVLSSCMIMWQTSAIIHGGERNYISAAIGIYVSLYNIFISLLSLIGMAGDD
ncbi:MAG: Bax inhibitor-1/YccA family protein [Cellvibrionaceae bacterium]|nr:Bax inhibitor-1/YccA family protein [Cellvibrionaceae bacterium]